MADSKNKKDSELSRELYHIAREKGTEAPFSGKYWDHHEKGMYICAVCGAELFSSDTKFDSGTGLSASVLAQAGWPSFSEPANKEHVLLKEDNSHGMKRTEVVCKKCGAHLGHVFPDLPAPQARQAGGPKEKGLPVRSLTASNAQAGTQTGGERYCINSTCLLFKSRSK